MRTNALIERLGMGGRRAQRMRVTLESFRQFRPRVWVIEKIKQRRERTWRFIDAGRTGRNQGAMLFS